MGIYSAPAGLGLAKQAQPVPWIPAAPPPLPQVIDQAGHREAIDRWIIALQYGEDLALQLRRDLFVRIHVQHPLVGRLGQGKALLLYVPRPGSLHDMASILPTHV